MWDPAVGKGENCSAESRPCGYTVILKRTLLASQNLTLKPSFSQPCLTQTSCFVQIERNRFKAAFPGPCGLSSPTAFPQATHLHKVQTVLEKRDNRGSPQDTSAQRLFHKGTPQVSWMMLNVAQNVSLERRWQTSLDKVNCRFSTHESRARSLVSP